MKQLPQFLRRLPYVFYALAVIFGIWRFWNDWSVVAESYKYAADAGMDYGPMELISRSAALYWGVTEAAYLVANGAMIHVLVAIYDKMKGSGE